MTIALAAAFGAAGPAAASADVVLNEVNPCEGGDWIELVNTGGDAADVSGWLLTDDPLDQDPPRPTHRMLFAEGTVIGPGGILAVGEGDQPNEFPFGIGCGGDTIRLADAAETLVDEIATPDLGSAGTDTWGRHPHGSGPWLQTIPTRGEPNEPSQGGGPGPDLAAWLFDPANVVEIDLDLAPESILALWADPDEYVDGSFELETTAGAHGPLDVGVRLKGGTGSFRALSGKAAFKVKFAHSVAGQRFFGLKTLTLNNMVQDPSMVHEVLAYRVFRELEIPAPRTGYAYLRLNGDDYGVYLNVETLDDVSLPRWFATTQHLYEGDYGDDTVPGGAGAFEVDEGEEGDRSDLEALIAAAQPSPDWPGQVAPVLDLERAVQMWAIEKYIGHWDGYASGFISSLLPNNYYLHSDDAGFFTMLPWGTDRTWQEQIEFDQLGGAMFLTCLEHPACSALYRERLAAVRASVPGMGLEQLAVETAEMLRPWQQLDPRREQSPAQIEAGVAEVLAFLRDRPGVADFWLDPPQLLRVGAPAARPKTRITARPGRTVSRPRVGFKFRSSQPGSEFECKLDSGDYAPCVSPKRVAVSRGRHRFLVRAVGPGGLRDRSPSVARFRVIE